MRSTVELRDAALKLKNHPSAAIRAEYRLRMERADPESPGIKKIRRAALEEEPLCSIVKNRNREGWW